MVVDEKLEELDWVKVRQELDEIYVVESLYAKAKRKIQENPLVPIGKLTFLRGRGSRRIRKPNLIITYTPRQSLKYQNTKLQFSAQVVDARDL